jgi:hypothetical protein
MRIRNWTRKFYEEEPGTGGEGGTADDSWLSALPAEMQSNATLQDIKTVESLAKQLIDTKAMVGSSVRVPSADASAEDMTAFRNSLLEKNVGLMAIPDTDNAELMAEVHKAMGQPEEASGYAKPEKWPGMSDERFGALTAAAHKIGMSKSHFEAMMTTMANDSNNQFSQMDTAFKSDIDTLKGEWGRAYEPKVARATNVATQLEAPPALIAALSEGSADSATLRWLDKVAEKFSGEGVALVTDPGGLSEDTPGELRERVAELTKKMLGMKSGDPQYQATLQKRMKYLEMLNPEKK